MKGFGGLARRFNRGQDNSEGGTWHLSSIFNILCVGGAGGFGMILVGEPRKKMVTLCRNGSDIIIRMMEKGLLKESKQPIPLNKWEARSNNIIHVQFNTTLSLQETSTLPTSKPVSEPFCFFQHLTPLLVIH